MNFINGKLVEQGSGIALEVDTGVKRGVLNLPFDAAKLKSHVGREVILGLRPERITDVRHAHNGDASHLQPFDVRVDVTEPTGPDTHVFAQVNGKRIVSRVHPAANPQPTRRCRCCSTCRRRCCSIRRRKSGSREIARALNEEEGPSSDGPFVLARRSMPRRRSVRQPHVERTSRAARRG